MRTREIVITSLIALLVIIANFVFYPAYISTTVTCRPQVFEEKYSENYYIAGYTSINTTTEEVTVKLIDFDKKTSKHEQIHVRQFQNRDQITCSYFGARVFIREVEAYAGQYYPDCIFNKLYGDFN